MPNVVELVKRAAVEAVEQGKPVHLLFGEVISASPLKIQTDQKSIYTEKMLVLTRNVTDYEVDMTVSHQSVMITHGHQVSGTALSVEHAHTVTGSTDDGHSVEGTALPVEHSHAVEGTAHDMNHNHPIRGQKKYLVHNALIVGDWVLLGRIQGGKRFVVLDRIKPIPELKGEWL